MMTWLKKWAVDAAAGYAKKYATTEQLTEWTVAGVNGVLAKVASPNDQAKMAQICATCQKVAGICTTVAKAIEDGTLTTGEAQAIANAVTDAIGTSAVTDEKLASLVDALAGKIKAAM